MKIGPLVIVETHPIQYHAPVYRTVQQSFDIPVTAIYGSDFSVMGYRDPEFGTAFAWDCDLLSGYTSLFLSKVRAAGARTAADVSAHGLSKLLQDVAPSAILLVGYSPRYHQAACYHSWRSGRPMIFRGETTDHDRKRTPIKAWARSRALGWLYESCTRLLYVGQRSYQHFKRFGHQEDRLVFSPYCVNTSPFECTEQGRARLRAVTRRDLEISEIETVLLFSGKLSRRKGPDLFVSAVKQLPAEVRANTVVLFLGSGELQPELQRMVSDEPQIQARFLGFRNQSQLSQYYHAADLLVLPSRWFETWGLVVNEALHHGVPCVVSEAVGCTPDLIKPGVTGEICEAGSVESLVGAVQRASMLTGRFDIRERCRERVNGYTVEKAAEGIAEAFWAVARPV